MCVVIDMNVMNCVFNSNNQNHEQFKPVKDWILNGKGKMVVGGDTYFEELGKLAKFRKFYLALRKAGKVVVVKPEKDIDALETKLDASLSHKNFDDPHIVALLIVSGCKIICSNDARAFPYFQKKEWYPKGRSLPKIYCDKSYSKHKEILTDNNMADICLPCLKLKKTAQQAFDKIAV